MVILRVMMIIVALSIVPISVWVGMYIDELYEPLLQPESDLNQEDIPLESPTPQF